MPHLAPQVNVFIEDARRNKRLSLLIIDDFHTIHTIQRPTSSETSTAIHMATCLINVHDAIASLALPPASVRYWPSADVCKGSVNVGRVIDLLNEYFPFYCKSTWMTTLPVAFSHLDYNDLEKSLVELR